MGKLQVVVGGQFGSEAKGAVTARLARMALRDGQDVTVARVAGPNAGHTAYDAQGRPWALRQIPAAMVVDERVRGVIAAGSEVDPTVIGAEIASLEAQGIPILHRLLIDEQATLLTPGHKETENGMSERLGSTAKGIGAARADRIMRTAYTLSQVETPGGLDWRDCIVSDTDAQLRHALSSDRGVVQIEGTQGFGLGLHAGYYPYCTSSDCRAIDFLAMAGLDPHYAAFYEPWVVLRTSPIRVAGNSGPLRGETSWEELGLPEERTTVTRKVRRVGSWNSELAARAVVANGGPSVVRVALTMLDQVVPGIAGYDGNPTQFAHQVDEDVFSDVVNWADRVHAATGVQPTLIGTGPNTMIEWRP